MWLKANSVASQRDAGRRELQLSRMQNMLASSAVDAQRGEYEPARHRRRAISSPNSGNIWAKMELRRY
jgi:hypothetical protein